MGVVGKGDPKIYCKCDNPCLAFWESATGAAICQCGDLIPCEFHLLLKDDWYPANYFHVDYFACKQHYGNAIDNVAGRGVI